jgi:hypothetical protein
VSGADQALVDGITNLQIGPFAIETDGANTAEFPEDADDSAASWGRIHSA